MSTALSKTIAYNGATIEVRRADVRARLRTSLVFHKLGLPDNPGEDWFYMQSFARFLTQCTVIGDLGFPVPTLTDDDEAFRAGYDAFLAADGDLYDTLNAALLEVNRAPGDPDLTLSADDTKKKTNSEAPLTSS